MQTTDNATRVAPQTPDEVVEAIRSTIDEIGLGVTTGYTLADAMREGSQHSTKREGGWIDGTSACALGAGYLAAKARGFIAQ